MEKASKRMGISPNRFKEFLYKQPINNIYRVVKIDGKDVTEDFPISKPSVRVKSIPTCVVKKDTGKLREFISNKEAAEFVGITPSLVSRLINTGISSKGYVFTREKKSGHRIMVNLLVFQTMYTDSTSVGRIGLVT